MNKPTEKQLDFIAEIESRLGIKFKGESRKDAFIFIRDNIETYNNSKPVRKKYRPCSIESKVTSSFRGDSLADYDEEVKRSNEEYRKEHPNHFDDDDEHNYAPGFGGWR